MLSPEGISNYDVCIKLLSFYVLWTKKKSYYQVGKYISSNDILVHMAIKKIKDIHLSLHTTKSGALTNRYI